MKVYLAESGNMFKVVAGTKQDKLWTSQRANEAVFDGVYILQSFYYCDSFTEKIIIPNCKSFLLDSGAFTAFTKGGGNWDDYIDRYAAFINRNKIDRFFELDIDVLVGYEEVMRLRKKLEDATGKPVIPVWHKSRGLDNYYRMCEEYGYVAVGSSTQQFAEKFPALIKIAHINGAKIHGLGFTNLSRLPECHFDSVDSSSWSSGGRYATAYLFDNGKFKTVKPKQGQRGTDYKGLTRHNWKEWVKFQKWADSHL